MKKTKADEKYDLIVIGGGASGLMAAGTAAAKGKQVLLLEKNDRLGNKLRITGGGRCNITNATFDRREFLAKFGRSEQFLYSPLAQFGIEDTFKFFEARGLPLVVEARNRVFPKSQKAADVFLVMERYVTNKKVEIIKSNPVFKLNVDRSAGRILSIKTKQGTYSAQNYLIATGGSSHPETGSTGDGFKWLAEIGHTVNTPSPSVVPLKVTDAWVKALSGVSLSFMKITFYLDDRKAFAATGKILFTHFGLSGPLILNLAQRVADLLRGGIVTAKIDCYPETDLGALERQLLKVFDQNKNKTFKNIAKEIAPKGLDQTLLGFGVIPDPERRVHEITRDERQRLARWLKALPLSIEGLMGLDRAVISDGGVPLVEVDPKTMKSRLYENLYLTGDILHINRPSGGYSLQLCWTTGYVAGQLN